MNMHELQKLRRRGSRLMHGPCLEPGCAAPGRYFIGRGEGKEKQWGYACDAHEKKIAAENVLRSKQKRPEYTEQELNLLFRKDPKAWWQAITQGNRSSNGYVIYRREWKR